MAIEKLNEEERNRLFVSNRVYTKGIDGVRQVDLKKEKFTCAVDVEDLGKLLIVKRKYYAFTDIEVEYYGDGCYLSCLYSYTRSSCIMHVSEATGEVSMDRDKTFSLFTGNFGRSQKCKVFIGKNKIYETVQVIAKQPLIKVISEIDGLHSRPFEDEYQKNCDSSILVKNIYSPSAEIIMRQIITTPYTGALKAKFVELKVIELLIHLMHINTYEDSMINSLPDEAMLYLERHYRENISEDEIARHFKIGKSTLRNKFLQAHGLSIQKTIMNLRMRDVSMMLEKGYGFARIAHRLNYRNQTDLKRIYYDWLEDDNPSFPEKSS